MMTDRQRRFRAEYQAQISPWYNGLVHVGVMYAVGITALAWCLMQLQNATWEWLLVIPVFLFSNLFEWWIHKYVMHRLVDVFALRAIYDRHTRQHHQYFTDGEMTVDSTREFRIIFFPWRAMATFMAFGTPFALLLGWAVNPNAGYILMVTIIGQYLIYETFHYCCHVHENAFVRHMPFVNTIRRHHTAHHNQGLMMERNMNLTFPIADWLMGTSDLNRGLLGHIFNGYSERHVKPELQPARDKHGSRGLQAVQ
ncbi:MAG: fatty acid hydroxylase family protein [Burkholderiales bacterium]|nr:fatty acid hydroxylase family protein [Burkholderiales bacterium]